jgi:hypothetical protein
VSSAAAAAASTAFADCCRTCARCLPVTSPSRAASVCSRMAIRLDSTTTHTCTQQQPQHASNPVARVTTTLPTHQLHLHPHLHIHAGLRDAADQFYMVHSQGQHIVCQVALTTLLLLLAANSRHQALPAWHVSKMSAHTGTTAAAACCKRTAPGIASPATQPDEYITMHNCYCWCCRLHSLPACPFMHQCLLASWKQQLLSSVSAAHQLVAKSAACFNCSSPIAWVHVSHL